MKSISSLRTRLLPVAVGSLLGLLAGGGLLLHAGQQVASENQRQLIDAWASDQLAALQLGLQRLARDTQNAARDPELLAALVGDAEQRAQAAANLLQHRRELVDVQLHVRGGAQLDETRAAPLNFAALDLLRRAEQGAPPPVEAYRIGSRWLLYSAIAIPAADGSVRGTLLLVGELHTLLDELSALPLAAGEWQLLQQFPGSPAQVLLQRGSGDGPLQHWPSAHPHWQLGLRPGTAGQPATLALWQGLLAGLLVLGGSLGGAALQQRRRRESEDEATAQQRRPRAGMPAPAESAPRQRIDLAGEPPAPAEVSPSAATDNPAASSDPLMADVFDLLDNNLSLTPPSMEHPASMNSTNAPHLPAGIFRAYDIRGVVGDSLTADTAYWIGRAIGSESLACGEPGVVVGRDGRLSGPELASALIRGLQDCGCNVTDVGMVPTPVLYFATHVLGARSGVMVTGSHNPPDYNGFKIVIAGDTLANERIQALYQRLENNDLASGNGSLVQTEVLGQYHQRIVDDVVLARPLKVVVDCGNGVAGVNAPQLIEALGCEVIPLFCDVDGTFPNHHPDPGKPENLKDLIAKVAETGADLGLAFDGDGDRVGVVTNAGEMIYPDRLLMLFARDVLSRNPGADVIFDVKCTRGLAGLISGYGGRPLMWKTGHSLIKAKMKETGALLAGEMSGHIFFKERWYGFDDGIYSAVRLLEILSLESRSAAEVFADFPVALSTPEINITVGDERKFALIEALQHDAQWGAANLFTLDGVRVDYPNGWGLVRASNTTPVLVLRFEADCAEELSRIQQVFHAQIKAVAPDLELPF
ncbi:phosphomannomutase / phosphoglucomutase [Pseudomonas linyingensis]|uniref:Phosphomannomutase/phosphoglucomutase n=2 Tax=Pseudomonas linyingensis TaxID=915471 RepID=A0A1H7B8B9_9PSED|nr:phosphomannomutase / phosphoglucomutase [Pseudomonas linyingensis]